MRVSVLACVRVGGGSTQLTGSPSLRPWPQEEAGQGLFGALLEGKETFSSQNSRSLPTAHPRPNTLNHGAIWGQHTVFPFLEPPVNTMYKRSPRVNLAFRSGHVERKQPATQNSRPLKNRGQPVRRRGNPRRRSGEPVLLTAQAHRATRA